MSISDPFSPVRLAPVSVNGTSVPQVGVEILNDDGAWEAINIHSQGYQLVPNSLAQQAGREIMSRSDLQWSQERMVWTGRFLSLMYRSDRIIEVPALGDAVSLGLRVENSYDGSAKFRLVLMAFVLSCTNGMMSPRFFSTYTMRHSVENRLDLRGAVDLINNGVTMLQDLAPRMSSLAGIRLNVKLLAEVAKNVDLPARDWGPILQNLSNAKTLWDLMQEVTHRLTYNGRGRALITTSEQVGDYFLGNLVDRLSA
ncbi:MAG TPA: DUF932 domain-containing protein [Candidatus Fermentibacter daniensis]|nr:DUF932 domain-containing protein [Candidatus Fermentibacter daniensis]HOR08353.1 DUF932 domain-containing protein [Candidatus Fermentibacter daniensis]HPK52720.1 DUF932 domain-containing protein [Candidatus Fermentibacter daniensis]